MTFARGCAAIALLAFGLTLAGCCGGGSDTTVKKTEVISTPTLGKQLEDLDQAYKSGAINKEEYEKARQNLLDQAGKEKKE